MKNNSHYFHCFSIRRCGKARKVKHNVHDIKLGFHFKDLDHFLFSNFLATTQIGWRKLTLTLTLGGRCVVSVKTNSVIMSDFSVIMFSFKMRFRAEKSELKFICHVGICRLPRSKNTRTFQLSHFAVFFKGTSRSRKMNRPEEFFNPVNKPIGIS